MSKWISVCGERSVKADLILDIDVSGGTIYFSLSEDEVPRFHYSLHDSIDPIKLQDSLVKFLSQDISRIFRFYLDSHGEIISYE